MCLVNKNLIPSGQYREGFIKVLEKNEKRIKSMTAHSDPPDVLSGAFYVPSGF
jgi:hypothetical protein